MRSVMTRDFPSGLSESERDLNSMACFFLDQVPLLCVEWAQRPPPLGIK